MLKVWNERMLKLCDQSGNEKDWCEAIGVYVTNLNKIRVGTRNFTIEQMTRAARLHRVSLDWIAGLTNVKAAKVEKLSGLQLLEEGLRILKDGNV